VPLYVLLAAACAALSIPLLTVAMVGGDRRGQRRIRQNLAAGLTAQGAGPAAAQNRNLLALLERLTLPANRAKLERLHALAGRPAAWSMRRVLLAKPALAIGVGLFGLLLLGARPGGPLLLLVVAVVVLAYFVPDLLLYSRGIERQAAITLALPDTLDQMMIAVEAGLGFEAAMSRAGSNGKGPLAEELIRTLQDMRVGLSRRDAYLALSERTSVPDLRAFVRAVVQADAYGISIAAVLRTQAKEMRLKRRQRAEEKALQIPVKVLFPLMLCILPTLFIAVLGPTVITVTTSF
jgi:tight adherence protein C